MKNIKIVGLDLKWFLIIVLIVVACCALNVLPNGMVGAFLFLMIFGALLNVIGNITPFIEHAKQMGYTIEEVVNKR